MKARAASRMRLIGMIRKESLQILRDPSSIAIAFVMPVVLLLLFGYGVSLDARHIPLAMVVEQPDTNTASLVGAFQHSEAGGSDGYHTLSTLLRSVYFLRGIPTDRITFLVHDVAGKVSGLDWGEGSGANVKGYGGYSNSSALYS